MECERVALIDGERTIRDDIICYIAGKPVLLILDGNIERYEHIPLHELDKLLMEYEQIHLETVNPENTENEEESPEE